MIKNYGLIINQTPDPKAYKLGAIELPKVVLRPDGQWDAYLPQEESQKLPNFDTFGCTVYGTENIQQILEKYYYGESKEYDERYNYNLVKIVPPGADPHEAAESFRNDGVVSGLLPNTETLEEYAKPRPMPNDIVAKGIAHPYELRHQWLWQNPIDKETRTKLIKEYLQYSPLAVSVTAWSERGGVYVDEGKPNTHWTAISGWNDKGWLVFDSYSPHKKILSYDHNIACCKSYQLVISTRKAQVSILMQIIQKLAQLLGLMQRTQLISSPQPNTPVEPVLAEPEPVVEVGKKLEAFCLAIRDYEGSPGDLNYRNNNPGNAKYSPVGYASVYGLVRKDERGFAIFKDYATGWLYLKNLVISKAKKNPEQSLLEFMKIYAPASDNNNPEAYASYIAMRIGVDKYSFKMKELLS